MRITAYLALVVYVDSIVKLSEAPQLMLWIFSVAFLLCLAQDLKELGKRL